MTKFKPEQEAYLKSSKEKFTVKRVITTYDKSKSTKYLLDNGKEYSGGELLTAKELDAISEVLHNLVKKTKEVFEEKPIEPKEETEKPIEKFSKKNRSGKNSDTKKSEK